MHLQQLSLLYGGTLELVVPTIKRATRRKGYAPR
eukprot:COSAG01_NODE_32403_length_582_cov_0.643892_1_plen_33_part_01